MAQFSDKSPGEKELERIKGIKPSGIVPVSLIRRIVEGTLAGEGATLGTPREWRDDEGNLIVQIDIMKDRAGFSSRGNKEYRCRYLVMHGLLKSSDQAHWPLWAAINIMHDVDDNIRTLSNGERCWTYLTNGGNELFVLQVPEADGEGNFHYWWNSDD